jgi:hypothetical protein
MLTCNKKMFNQKRILKNSEKSIIAHMRLIYVEMQLIYVNILLIHNMLRHKRIRVKTGPTHPLVCRKRRLNGGGPSDETGKTEAPRVTAGVHDKDFTLLKGPERRA